jgi:hypothetical protein
VASSGDRVRGPGVLMTSIALAFILVLGVVALTASQQSPATVAEFAPAAVDQITKAPPQQGSAEGSGPGSGTVGASASPSASAKPSASASASAAPSASASPSAAPTSPPVDTAKVRACVGNPPRQIEDPQSPPCVNYWKGDNGGVTSFGVTADEIRVAYPKGAGFETPPAYIDAVVAFFNKRFEFYGRKIRLIPFYVRGDTFAEPVPADMIADAKDIKEKYQAFATTGYLDRKGAEGTFHDELARLKVVNVAGGGTAALTEAHLRDHAPYQWSRGMAVDTFFQNTGQFVCNVLADKPAIYGGPYTGAVTTPTRKLGVLYTVPADGTTPDIKPMTSVLKACGQDPVIVQAPRAVQANDAVNPIVALSQANVTSVICLCDIGSTRNYFIAASGQGYYPEWILNSYVNNDIDNSFQNSTPDQTDHVIGISQNNRWNRTEDSPWYQAVTQGDPSLQLIDGAQAPPMTSVYEQLLVVASGIQMAGPNLTPETFQAGLQRTTFPNPGAGGPPYYQAKVGFQGGGHAMKLDAAMYWYELTRQSTYNPNATGAVCWVDHGVRFGLGTWPKRDFAFRVPGQCL